MDPADGGLREPSDDDLDRVAHLLASDDVAIECLSVPEVCDAVLDADPA
ncbi:hypothetical protein [Streptomyces sp. cmx-4-9]